ncbi:alpha/beta-hydrolase [Neoconidiobolus thromboides FSU 785]|nr:alpha/beta-hydrolase [Neoconidiobolus thromboides FSU 785]
MFFNTLKHILIALLLYVGLLVILIFEPFQGGLVYLNWLNFPAKSLLSDPTNFTIHKDLEVFNFYIQSEGYKLGVYHFIPKSVKTNLLLKLNNTINDEDINQQKFFETSLLDENLPIILFLHGNAGNRASSVRYPSYIDLSLNLHTQVLVLDYRGFGDSEGKPSEVGLFMDSLSLWKFLIKKGVKQSQITIMGHSLGTGVASKLTKYLNDKSISPKSLVLSAPYTSIPDAMYEYKLFRVVPLLYPVMFSPWLKNKVSPLINHPFDTKKIIKSIKSPTLILHGEKDDLIPVKHGIQLKDEVLVNESKDIKKVDWKFEKEEAVGEYFRLKDRKLAFIKVKNATHDSIPLFQMYSKGILKFWENL